MMRYWVAWAIPLKVAKPPTKVTYSSKQEFLQLKLCGYFCHFSFSVFFYEELKDLTRNLCVPY
ncbi:MAG: hypothetical protein AABY76_01555, partial [Planctomycetota bacterium]